MTRVPVASVPHGPAPAALAGVLLALAIETACGKPGPPLPPLVRVPAAPADVTAERRGGRVDLQFTVPSLNADGTKPANVQRVDVYGLTGPGALTDDQFLKAATKVGSVLVKAPRDPNDAAEPDDPDADAAPPEGKGLDQGAMAHLEEILTPDLMAPPARPSDRNSANPADRKSAKPVASTANGLAGPLLGPPEAVASRTYVALGIGRRGQKGRLSKRASVALAEPPPPPRSLEVTYDETTVTLKWASADLAGSSAPAGAAAAPASESEALLPARPIGLQAPGFAYNVYELRLPASSGGGGPSAPVPEAPSTPVGVRLTKTPLADLKYTDQTIEWGTERCFEVRTVETFDKVAVESGPAQRKCTGTFVDTFPPAAPKGLTAVPTDGAVNLIWEPNNEKDLAGYLLFRAVPPGGALERLTPTPVQDTTFEDRVPSGVRHVYTVRAIDKAGNVSPPSTPVEAMAR